MSLRIRDTFLVLTTALTLGLVVSSGARAAETVILVVEDLVLPEIQTEVNRLSADIQAKGFATKVKAWNLTTDGGTEELWNYLKSEYGSPGSLHGAILIGNLPKAKNSSNEEYTDLVYWNMTSTYRSTFTRNIWVSRMCALDGNGAELYYGDEVKLLKRALDANHNYRTGASRLPHSVYHYDSAYPGAAGDMNYALTIWPYVEYLSPHLAFQYGCELIHEESHGSGGAYNEGKTSTSSVHDFLAQARFVNVSSCSSGTFGGVVNNQILTRGGGNVFSVGASTTAYSGQIILMQNTTADATFRSRLAAGDTWGQAYLKSFPYTDYYRLVFYGDLSIPAKAAPANQLPVVAALAADKTEGAAPLTVNFSGGAASDPDGSIALYEWFPTGHQYGTAVPEYAGSSPKPPVSHTYAVAHRYKPRLEVMDNYMARARSETSIAVAPEPGKPVRINCGYTETYYTPGLDYTDGAGDLWLHDQAFATGTWGYSGGSVTVSTAAVNDTADDVLYQTYRTQTSFTYKVPLACGSYTLRLGFADMASSAAGARVMDVDVEDVTAITGLDVFALAGAKTAMKVDVPVEILDGELTLTVRKNAAATSNAFLNCFEILIPDPTNNWPMISSYSPESPLTLAAGRSQTFSVEAWEPDGDAVTYKWRLDGAAVPVAGVSMTYSPTAADAGLHNIEVLVSDGRGGVARKSWDVTVTASTVTVSASDAWASEPSTDTGRFTISRTSPTADALTVKYSVGGTAGNGTDYQSLSGTAVIPAGSTYVYVYVTPIDDALVEGKESVALTLLADAAYKLGATTGGEVNLLDNEMPVVTASATDAWASEAGADPGQFKISRTGATTAALTVNYSVGGTATNGTDYNTLSGSAVIPAGATYVYVDVAPKDDSSVEDKETVVLTVEEGTGYQTGSAISATVNLLDDEMPILTVAVGDDVAAEPSNPGTFVITRSGKINVAVTVSYSMGGGAAKGTDYTAPTGTVTLASGVTSATVTIDPIDDTAVEGRESVSLTVASGTGYQVGSPSGATLYLYDDEKPYVTVEATDAVAAEAGGDVGKFTITCLPAPASATVIAYTMSGTATNGVDYETLSGSVTVAAKAATAVITLTPIADSVSESTESAKLTLAAGTTYQTGTPNYATVNIANGSSAVVAPSITTQPASRTVTSGQTATFSVTASGTAPLSYQWKKNGSNVSGATSSSYTTPATTAADSGSLFSVVVSNSAGSATSSNATLTVTVPTCTITASAGTGGTISPSGSVAVSQGSSKTFAITANSGYQIAGVTVDGSSVGAISSYTFSNVTANHTIAATFSAVAVPPTITTQPMSKTVTAGQTATFSVAASGTAPLTYQWRKNDSNISGATSASYTTPATTAADSGSLFSVVVSNSAGSVVSANAVLTVNVTPTIVLHVASITMTKNASKAGTQAQAEVVIVDGNGVARSGVTVTGTWSGLSNVTASGATGVDGSVILVSGKSKKSGTFTFSVTDVSAPDCTYDPSKNVVTSGSIAN